MYTGCARVVCLTRRVKTLIVYSITAIFDGETNSSCLAESRGGIEKRTRRTRLR